MNLRLSETLSVVVPFPDGEFFISAVTLAATIDALEDACRFRKLDPKEFSLGVLKRGKK